MKRTKRYWVMAAVLLLAAGSPAIAQIPDKAQELTEHLQFLGYKVEPAEDLLRATFDGPSLDFTLKKWRGGLLLMAAFGVADEALSGGPTNELLSFVNSLNKEATVGRFYFDDTDKTVTIEAWYGGDYDRERFGQFMQAWKGDTESNFLGNHSEEAVKLLK